MQIEHLNTIIDHAYSGLEPEERLHWNVRTRSGGYRHCDYALETIPMKRPHVGPSTTVLLTRDGSPPLYLELDSIESLEVSCG